jgi:polysaccharide export outer membrane protein
MSLSRTLSLVLSSALLGAISSAQTPQAAPNQTPQGATNQTQLLGTLRPDYTLGSNDQIVIRTPQVEEINDRPYRIDADGFLKLPILGKVRAGGLTVQAVEADLVTKLRDYIRDPQVTITVVQYRSDPVFVVGMFRAPGIYPLVGNHTLVELVSSIGGLQPNASRRIKITRRAEYGAIPLPNSIESKDKRVSSVEVSLESLTQAINPAEDIVLQAYDIISADQAQKVYVNGEVTKVSGIELNGRDNISVIQALTEAGGLTQYATRERVVVLRPVLGTSRRAEINIDLKRVLEGKDIDFPLLPNDVLYVPRSAKRSVALPAGVAFLAQIPYILGTALLASGL